MTKKILLFCVALITAISSQVFAAEQHYYADGIYIATSSEPLTEAKQHALEDAMRQAVEQAGVNVTAETNANKNEVTNDEVTTLASNIVKIADKKYDIKMSGNNIEIHVDIDALIDPDSIAPEIFRIQQENKKIKQQANKEDYEADRNLQACLDHYDVIGSIDTICMQESDKLVKEYIDNPDAHRYYWDRAMESLDSIYAYRTDDNPDQDIELDRYWLAMLESRPSIAGTMLDYWYSISPDKEKQEMQYLQLKTYALIERGSEDDCRRAIKIIDYLDNKYGPIAVGREYTKTNDYKKHPYTLRCCGVILRNYLRYYLGVNI